VTEGYPTEQEEFWANEFGDAYVERNIGDVLLASKTSLFASIMARADCIQSVIEFGCNVGLNLVALKRLIPTAELTGIEINTQAARRANESGFSVVSRSILGYRSERHFDLVLIAGVLIHIDPSRLDDVYDALHSACGRYLCIVEYYSPDPVEVSYHGHRNRLFKRDFAGEVLDRFSDLRLLDYGFVYHRAPQFGGGDETWFLLERDYASFANVAPDHK
jgi:spore coat polysaccharide biosynthesis protein SpsF